MKIYDNITTFTVEQLLEVMDNIPVCINVLDKEANSIYCNRHTVDLYEVGSKQDYIDKFYDLTPKTQPNGKNSKQAFKEYVLSALENGEAHFNWLDVDLDGKEIPLYISIYSLKAKENSNERMLVSTMQDLRPYLVGDNDHEGIDPYYYNRISYKDLFNNIAELSDEWFWVYDAKKSTIQFHGKGRDILGLSAEKQNFPDYVVDNNMVYPDDLGIFLNFNDNLKKGVIEPVEVRFVAPSGVSKYYKIMYKTRYDKQGSPAFSVGKTYDIDKQKRLEVLSKTDLLTNCLNKITTENSVKSILESSPTSSHALFIIDVDDFKSVNDDLGHYFGDVVLSDIAKNLHANFRGADIIGRIGGDEFLVFIKDISDEKIIARKAKAIADAFKNSFAGQNNDYKVSGSIGVSLFPKHATSYEGLYKCADKALYNSKTEGKDRYTIYSDAIAENDTKILTKVDTSNNPTNTFYDVNITSAVFDVLYQSDNVARSMNIVLKMMGNHMNVDSCYVAQTFDNGSSYSVTYEWTQNGSSPKKDSFRDVSAKDLSEFFAELEQNGVMYNNDMRHSQIKNEAKSDDVEATKSYLLAQTKGKGYARLIFGLDDNSENRLWSEKEINTVQYVIKLISIFMSSANINNNQNI